MRIKNHLRTGRPTKVLAATVGVTLSVAAIFALYSAVTGGEPEPGLFRSDSSGMKICVEADPAVAVSRSDRSTAVAQARALLDSFKEANELLRKQGYEQNTYDLDGVPPPTLAFGCPGGLVAPPGRDAAGGPFRPINPSPVAAPSPFQVHVYVVGAARMAEWNRLAEPRPFWLEALEIQCTTQGDGACGTVTTALFMRAEGWSDAATFRAGLEEAVGLGELMRSLRDPGNDETKTVPATSTP